jgi:DNA-binding NarL/FixJ family response regulator
MEASGFLSRNVVVIDMQDTATDIASVLNDSEKFRVAATYENSTAALENIEHDRPDIILMELELPGGNGIAFLKEIRSKYPDIDVVILSQHDHYSTFIEAFKNGAAGYLVKTPSGITKIDLHLESFFRGGAPLSDVVIKKLVESFRKSAFTPLTIRETQILKLIVDGNSYSQIASELKISKETSKTHIKNIYRKLMVNSKSQAVKMALTEKLI